MKCAYDSLENPFSLSSELCTHSPKNGNRPRDSHTGPGVMQAGVHTALHKTAITEHKPTSHDRRMSTVLPSYKAPL